MQPGAMQGDKLPADPRGFGFRCEFQCPGFSSPEGGSIPKGKKK